MSLALFLSEVDPFQAAKRERGEIFFIRHSAKKALEGRESEREGKAHAHILLISFCVYAEGRGKGYTVAKNKEKGRLSYETKGIPQMNSFAEWNDTA